MIKDNLLIVESNIANACKKAGRNVLLFHYPLPAPIRAERMGAYVLFVPPSQETIPLFKGPAFYACGITQDLSCMG